MKCMKQLYTITEGLMEKEPLFEINGIVSGIIKDLVMDPENDGLYLELNNQYLKYLFRFLISPYRKEHPSKYEVSAAVVRECHAQLIPSVTIFANKLIKATKKFEIDYFEYAKRKRKTQNSKSKGGTSGKRLKKFSKSEYRDQTKVISELVAINSTLLTNDVWNDLAGCMENEYVDCRLAYIDMFATIFTQSNPNIVRKFPTIFRMFLKRFDDISSEIRKFMARILGELLLQSSINQYFYTDLMDYINKRLNDTDSGIRSDIIVNLCSKVGISNPNIISNNSVLFNNLMKRSLDKAYDVRYNAMYHLSNLFNAHITPQWRSKTQVKGNKIQDSIQKFYQIPQQFILNLKYVDLQTRLNVESIVDHKLLAYGLASSTTRSGRAIKDKSKSKNTNQDENQGFQSSEMDPGTEVTSKDLQARCNVLLAIISTLHDEGTRLYQKYFIRTKMSLQKTVKRIIDTYSDVRKVEAELSGISIANEKENDNENEENENDNDNVSVMTGIGNSEKEKRYQRELRRLNAEMERLYQTFDARFPIFTAATNNRRKTVGTETNASFYLKKLIIDQDDLSLRKDSQMMSSGGMASSSSSNESDDNEVSVEPTQWKIRSKLLELCEIRNNLSNILSVCKQVTTLCNQNSFGLDVQDDTNGNGNTTAKNKNKSKSQKHKLKSNMKRFVAHLLIGLRNSILSFDMIPILLDYICVIVEKQHCQPDKILRAGIVTLNMLCEECPNIFENPQCFAKLIHLYLMCVRERGNNNINDDDDNDDNQAEGENEKENDRLDEKGDDDNEGDGIDGDDGEGDNEDGEEHEDDVVMTGGTTSKGNVKKEKGKGKGKEKGKGKRTKPSRAKKKRSRKGRTSVASVGSVKSRVGQRREFRRAFVRQLKKQVSYIALKCFVKCLSVTQSKHMLNEWINHGSEGMTDIIDENGQNTEYNEFCAILRNKVINNDDPKNALLVTECLIKIEGRTSNEIKNLYNDCCNELDLSARYLPSILASLSLIAHYSPKIFVTRSHFVIHSFILQQLLPFKNEELFATVGAPNTDIGDTIFDNTTTLGTTTTATATATPTSAMTTTMGGNTVPRLTEAKQWGIRILVKYLLAIANMKEEDLGISKLFGNDNGMTIGVGVGGGGSNLNATTSGVGGGDIDIGNDDSDVHSVQSKMSRNKSETDNENDNDGAININIAGDPFDNRFQSEMERPITPQFECTNIFHVLFTIIRGGQALSVKHPSPYRRHKHKFQLSPGKVSPFRQATSDEEDQQHEEDEDGGGSSVGAGDKRTKSKRETEIDDDDDDNNNKQKRRLSQSEIKLVIATVDGIFDIITRGRYRQLLDMESYYELIFLAHHEYEEIRHFVLKKVFEKLRDQHIPDYYCSCLVLVATDDNKQIKDGYKTALSRLMQRMRKQYQLGKARSGRAGGSLQVDGTTNEGGDDFLEEFSSADSRMLTKLPEYLIFYLIHLLSHHPDYSDRLAKIELKQQMRARGDTLDDTLIDDGKGNRNYNPSDYLQRSRILKENKLSPVRRVDTSKLPKGQRKGKEKRKGKGKEKEKEKDNDSDNETTTAKTSNSKSTTKTKSKGKQKGKGKAKRKTKPKKKGKDEIDNEDDDDENEDEHENEDEGEGENDNNDGEQNEGESDVDIEMTGGKGVKVKPSKKEDAQNDEQDEGEDENGDENEGAQDQNEENNDDGNTNTNTNTNSNDMENERKNESKRNDDASARLSLQNMNTIFGYYGKIFDFFFDALLSNPRSTTGKRGSNFGRKSSTKQTDDALNDNIHFPLILTILNKIDECWDAVSPGYKAHRRLVRIAQQRLKKHYKTRTWMNQFGNVKIYPPKMLFKSYGHGGPPLMSPTRFDSVSQSNVNDQSGLGLIITPVNRRKGGPRRQKLYDKKLEGSSSKRRDRRGRGGRRSDRPLFEEQMQMEGNMNDISNINSNINDASFMAHPSGNLTNDLNMSGLGMDISAINVSLNASNIVNDNDGISNNNNNNNNNNNKNNNDINMNENNNEKMNKANSNPNDDLDFLLVGDEQKEQKNDSGNKQSGGKRKQQQEEKQKQQQRARQVLVGVGIEAGFEGDDEESTISKKRKSGNKRKRTELQRSKQSKSKGKSKSGKKENGDNNEMENKEEKEEEEYQHGDLNVDLPPKKKRRVAKTSKEKKSNAKDKDNNGNENAGEEDVEMVQATTVAVEPLVAPSTPLTRPKRKGKSKTKSKVTKSKGKADENENENDNDNANEQEDEEMKDKKQGSKSTSRARKSTKDANEEGTVQDKSSKSKSKSKSRVRNVDNSGSRRKSTRLQQQQERQKAQTSKKKDQRTQSSEQIPSSTRKSRHKRVSMSEDEMETLLKQAENKKDRNAANESDDDYDDHGDQDSENENSNRNIARDKKSSKNKNKSKDGNESDTHMTTRRNTRSSKKRAQALKRQPSRSSARSIDKSKDPTPPSPPSPSRRARSRRTSSIRKTEVVARKNDSDDNYDEDNGDNGDNGKENANDKSKKGPKAKTKAKTKTKAKSKTQSKSKGKNTSKSKESAFKTPVKAKKGKKGKGTGSQSKSKSKSKRKSGSNEKESGDSESKHGYPLRSLDRNKKKSGQQNVASPSSRRRKKSSTKTQSPSY